MAKFLRVLMLTICFFPAVFYFGDMPAAFAASGAEPRTVTDEYSVVPPDVHGIGDAQRSALGVSELESALPGEAVGILGDLSVMDSLDIDSVLTKLYEGLSSGMLGIVKRGMKSAVVIMAVVILISVTASIYDGGSVPDFIPLAGTVIISAVAIGDVRAFIGLGGSTLQSLSDFSKILLPTLSAAAAASGAVTSASAKYLATALFMDITLTLAVKVIMPLIYAYIAVTIANSAVGNSALSACAGLIKWLCQTSMITLVIAFSAYLSISGVVTGSADAVATRIAKTTLSTTLPVVGSIISDAASTVVVGIGVLKNAVGIFGLIGVVATCLYPFLTLGAQYLCYKFAAGVCTAMSDSRMSGLISGMGSAFGMVLSLTGAGAIMLFFSIISSIKVVTGL